MSEKLFEQSALWPDVQDIIETPKKTGRHLLLGEVSTVSNGEKFPIYKIISVDTIADYANNVADVIEIEFMVLFGDYVKRLFPFRDNLEVSLKRQIFIEGTTTPDPNQKVEVERYKAIFQINNNIVVDVSQFKLIDYISLNQMQPVTVKLQLMNRFFEPFRVKMVTGSVYQRRTQKDLIHSITGSENVKIQVDGQNPIEIIDIVEPDNTEPRTQVVFRDDIPVINLPTYLQEKSQGVYNASLGSYFATWNKKRCWFVYPLHKTNRFTDDRPKVTFYDVPQNRFQGINRTYKVDGKTLKVVCTADKRYVEATDEQNLNAGVGFRMADSRNYMSKPIQIDENGPVGKRANVNHEVGMVYRDDGLNFARFSKDRVGSNAFLEYSKIIHRQMARIDVTWEHSDPTQLYPGMPCKYIFLEDNLPVELPGTVLFAHSMEAPISKDLNEKVFETITFVTMAVQTHKFKPDTPKNDVIGEY